MKFRWNSHWQSPALSGHVPLCGQVEVLLHAELALSIQLPPTCGSFRVYEPCVRPSGTEDDDQVIHVGSKVHHHVTHQRVHKMLDSGMFSNEPKGITKN